MTSAPLGGVSELHPQSEADRLVDRLEDPRTAAALHSLLDNAELLAVIVEGLDGLARRGEVIGDTIAEVVHEVRAAGQATGLDPVETSRQLATVIPTLADASPAINRILESPIVEEKPIEVLSETAEALVAGLESARSKGASTGMVGLMAATRDPDVRRGMGFAIEVLRAFGREIDDSSSITQPSD